MAFFRGSTTVLAEKTEWISQVGMRERHDSITGSVFADQAGTIFLEQSGDGTNWDVSTSYSIEASKSKGFVETLVLPYWRVRYKNGNTNQGTFRISVTTQAGGDS